MPVMIVRRKPTTQRALRWTGTNLGEARAFLGDDYAGVHIDNPDILLIWTLEHRRVPFEARPGSVLMEGSTHGEHWAVAPAVFVETYRLRGLARLRAWVAGWWTP